LISFEVLTGAFIVVPWVVLRRGAGIARSAEAVKGCGTGRYRTHTSNAASFGGARFRAPE
jgi:hypothetical protein